MRLDESPANEPLLDSASDARDDGPSRIDLPEQAAENRADDDGMAHVDGSVGSAVANSAGLLFGELGELSLRGGARDEPSLEQFQRAVTTLRALPGATGPFRAKVASASGWASLLFSSWRHRKYDQPNSSGADRVRAFITRDLQDARRMSPRDGGSGDPVRNRGVGGQN